MRCTICYTVYYSIFLSETPFSAVYNGHLHKYRIVKTWVFLLFALFTHKALHAVSLLSLSFLSELKSEAAWSRPRSSLIFSQP